VRLTAAAITRSTSGQSVSASEATCPSGLWTKSPPRPLPSRVPSVTSSEQRTRDPGHFWPGQGLPDGIADAL